MDACFNLSLYNLRWENLIYQIGAHDALIKHVIVNGKVAYTKQN